MSCAPCGLINREEFEEANTACIALLTRLIERRPAPLSLILHNFVVEEDMVCLVLLPLAFGSGFLLGRWKHRRWRHDRFAAGRRRLQLLVLSLEVKSLRQKMVSAQGRRTPPARRRLMQKRPTLKWWRRRLIAWLRLRWPWLTRFMRFSPTTYIRAVHGFPTVNK